MTGPPIHRDEATDWTSMVSQVPGKNVLMPDIYADTHDVTEPLLNILELESPLGDTSSGFNPYDTAVLHEKKGGKKVKVRVT